jgi:hypothetical protein
MSGVRLGKIIISNTYLVQHSQCQHCHTRCEMTFGHFLSLIISIVTFFYDLYAALVFSVTDE